LVTALASPGVGDQNPPIIAAARNLSTPQYG
jgi:hypothetical protein